MSSDPPVRRMRPLVRPSRDAVPARPATDPLHLARLKAVVREELRLGPDCPVMVSQLECGDDTCAPVETLVAVLDPAGRRVWRLSSPVTDVAPALLRDLVRTSPEGARHDH
jgi:hypothetical protein